MTALLLLLLGVARGDDVLENVEDIADLDISDLLGVVESASNMLEPRATAPAAVFVMHREEILHAGSRNIPELLKSVPGVDVVYIAPGMSLVAMRGLGGLQGNNLVVLVDGVRVNSPVDGTVDWEHIAVSVEDLERIEVVRGPVSAIYGSDAYTGVVSLVTMKQKADGFVTAGTLDFGIDGSLETTERAYAGAGWKKDGVTLMASGRVLRDATWGAEFEDPEDETPLREATGRVGATILTGQFETTARLDLATSTRAWMDHLVLEPTPTHSDEATLYAGSKYRAYGLLRTIELETQHRVLRMEAPDGFVPDGFTYAGTNARIGDYQLNAGLRPARWLQVGLGLETGWENVNAPYIHPSEAGVLRGRYGGNGSARVELGDWALSVSGRADVTSRLPELTWSERASLTYVKQAFTLRASVASGFREPSYVELGARLIDPDSNLILLEGEPDLLPPRLKSAELGLIAIPARGSRSSRWCSSNAQTTSSCSTSSRWSRRPSATTPITSTSPAASSTCGGARPSRRRSSSERITSSGSTTAPTSRRRSASRSRTRRRVSGSAGTARGRTSRGTSSSATSRRAATPRKRECRRASSSGTSRRSRRSTRPSTGRCWTTSRSGSRCAACGIRRTRTNSPCPRQRPPTGRSLPAWS
jgi:iron complex outermembrane receptor protein